MNIRERLWYGIGTLADQEEALKSPEDALLFAQTVEGADIEKCQEAACKDPMWACEFAQRIPGANIQKLQEAACKDPKQAYVFQKSIKEASKEYCCKAACINPHYFYVLLFNKEININEYSDCLKYLENNKNYAVHIARDIKNIPEDIQLKLIDYLTDVPVIPNNITSKTAREKWNNIQTMKKACE